MNPALLQKGSNSFRTDSEIKDHEGLQICFTSKVTYCDKEPSLLPFQFMSYLPLIDLKNGF